MLARKALCVLFTIFAVAAAPRQGRADHPAHAEEQPVRPERNGFTLELGLGVGLSHVTGGEGGSLNKIGIAPLSVSLGWFLDDDWAVMLRMAGAAYFRRAVLEYIDGTQEEALLTGVIGFYGAHVQHWFNDWLFVSGGPGLALHALLKDGFSGVARDAGFGFGLRAGISTVTWKNHSLGFSLELFPSVIGGRFAIAEALKLEWQWF